MAAVARRIRVLSSRFTLPQGHTSILHRAQKSRPGPKRMTSIVVALALLGVSSACGRGGGGVGDQRAAMLPKGAPTAALFAPGPVGDPIRGEDRPRISNVQVVDLDRDGLADILVC